MEDNKKLATDAELSGYIEVKAKSTRGFASMDKEQQKAIARKGGLAISQNREHMSKIGQKGGTTLRKSKQTNI